MSGLGACWESACACVQLGLGWESPNRDWRGRAVLTALWTEMGTGGCPGSRSVLWDPCIPRKVVAGPSPSAGIQSCISELVLLISHQ